MTLCICGVVLIYGDFAYLYDRLMHDVDYKQWADYVEAICMRSGLRPRLIADLGCGTGSFCLEMSQKGYEMIGVDQSAEMLSCARQKALDSGADILFLNQDMTRFELYGTVDVITSLMDSVNYVTYKRDLRRFFKLAANYLNPGGLFIFDINTPFKFNSILSNNTFGETDQDVAYVWQNCFDSGTRLCRFDLTFFVSEGDRYRRFDEVQYERCYEKEELSEMLAAVGFKTLSVYDALRFRKPPQDCERMFFVCKKAG